MSTVAFTPTPLNPSFNSHKFVRTKPNRFSLQSKAIVTSDPFVLELAETLEDSLPSSTAPLQKLREASSESLLSTPWPSRRDEPFRFTDLSFLRYSNILPVSQHPPTTTLPAADSTSFLSLNIADGHPVTPLSNSSQLPQGVYVGTLSALASTPIIDRVMELMCAFDAGDLFWSINGVGAPDATVVYVPEGCRVETPIYLRYLAVEGGAEGSKTMRMSNPRVVVVVEKGAEVGIIEEFSAAEEGNDCYWTNSALEAVVGEGAKLTHSYIQNQSSSSAHIKWTSIRQESSSTYELTEISTGGKLGRHNLHIQQLGPDTVTELSTLHLSVGDQTQDLHSSLVLDHPRGYSRQLHKCIVAHSKGQAVFDGNIKVNRYAQQTDAGQLTRSLLLEPRASINVKPNLQIVADDVKCSHGAAISDLEESQLLYFRARGIDPKSARRVLIFAFGGEVIEKLFMHFLPLQHLPCLPLRLP